MRRDEAIQRLRQHRAEFVKLGVAHMRLFGSVARDEADDDSDVDVVVDTPDGRALGLFSMADVAEELERILGRPADLISWRGLDYAPRLRREITRDLVDVF